MLWLYLLLGIPLTFSLVLYLLYKFYTGNKGYWPKNNVFYIDMNKVVPFWDAITFKIPFHELELKMYQAFKSGGPNQKFGGYMEWRKPMLLVYDLDLIKNITVKDFDHFVNRRPFNKDLSDDVSKDMLINKESQEWRDLRSTMSPTFTTSRLKQMFQVFNESGVKLAKFLEEQTASNDPGGIDIRDSMTRYTLDVIASAAFGFDSQIFKDKDSPFSKWVTKLQNPFAGFWKFCKLMVAIFVPKVLGLLKIKLVDQEAMDFFTKVIQETIKRREESGEKRNDFIQLLIDAKVGELEDDNEKTEQDDAQGTVKRLGGKVKLTNHLILSQALLFFFAGFDTMETLLMFALYELALNPEVQEKLFEEIDEAMKENDGELGFDKVNHMEYLEKVISETLRKYPPAIRTERQCTIPYKLPNSDYVLKKGSLVVIPMYGIHYDKEYFPEPERFDPERFSPEVKATRHPYAYMPFGTGPRNCIAMRFALIEGKTALAHIIHKFKVEPSEKTCIPLKVGRVSGFKPEGGMWLKVSKRQ